MSVDLQYQLEYSCHFAQHHRFHCYRAYLPTIYTTTHVDHEKTCIVFSFYACMWFCSYGYIEHFTWQPIWATRDLLLTTREQVHHPYLANLYSLPLFPPPLPAGRMWIAVKAWKLGISDNSIEQSIHCG